MQNTKGTKKGLVLIAHGSREEATQIEMNQLVSSVQKARPGFAVVGAYMEIQEPTLQQAIAGLNDQNIQEIEVCPLFIFRGRHMPRATSCRYQ